MQNRTGYQFVFKHNDRFGVSVARKDARFRRDGIPTLFDAVRVLNQSGLAKHPLPRNPYRMLDKFLAEHKAPQTESVKFADVFDRLKDPWKRIAQAPLSKHQLSKLLRARGFEIYKSGSNLKIRGLTL